MKIIRLVVVCFLLIITCSSVLNAAIIPYTVTDLFAMTQYNSRITDINDHSDVIGFSELKTQVYQSMLWQDGIVITLGTLGGNSTVAYGINDKDQITGYSTCRNSSSEQTFVWEDGTMKEVPDLGGANSFGYSINGNGIIAGYSQRQTYDNGHAYINNGTNVQDLGILTGIGSRASSINNTGQVVGTYWDQSNISHACMWDSSTTTDFRTLGGPDSYANSINNNGVVIGTSDINSTYFHAFIWKNGKMFDLGDAGHHYSNAYDINDNELVVGSYDWPNSLSARACAWNNGTLIDLNNYIPANSGWILLEAFAVNNNGQIAGKGLYNGQYRGFLLTPVPEPSAILALVCGIGSLGGLVLRRKSS